MEQERKKCDKAKKPGAMYRAFKATSLRQEAAHWERISKEVLAVAADTIAELTLQQLTPRRTQMIGCVREASLHRAGWMLRRATELRGKAARLTSGYKRSHHKVPALARIRERHAAQGAGWDILAPVREQSYPSLRREPIVGVVAVLQVGAYGLGQDAHGDYGQTGQLPLLGVAWNERIKGEPVPDAPMSGVFRIV